MESVDEATKGHEQNNANEWWFVVGAAIRAFFGRTAKEPQTAARGRDRTDEHGHTYGRAIPPVGTCQYRPAVGLMPWNATYQNARSISRSPLNNFTGSD